MTDLTTTYNPARTYTWDPDDCAHVANRTLAGIVHCDDCGATWEQDPPERGRGICACGALQEGYTEPAAHYRWCWLYSGQDTMGDVGASRYFERYA